MRYDLIVIGGGPAGYLASERAAHAKLNVLCIEKNNVGGVCLNEGCVPTKTLLYSAKLYDGAKHGAKYGIMAQDICFDHKTVVARKNKVIKLLTGGIKSTLKLNGATLISGEATIVGKTDDDCAFKVQCAEEIYEGERLLIATGSSPAIPPITGLKDGLESGFVVTNREILALTEVPEKLVVIGGGVIGLEMASYFNSVGSNVTVIEMLDHIAGENDKKLTAVLQKNYEKKGVIFKLGAKVTAVKEAGVEYELGGETATIPADKVLLSIGRRANTTGIGLETIGVATERGAVITDAHMRTNVKNVYAAGDVNGKSMLAHTAYREAEVAVNDMLGIDDEMNYGSVPSVIYTNPELASVGLTQDDATAKGIDFKTVELPMRYSGKYLAENEGGDGICRLIVGSDGRILGVQALCNYASEFIIAAGIMVETGMTVEQAKKLIFPHPTVGEIIREAIFQCD